MKNNRWKKALTVALVCCMLAGTGLTFENWGVEFDATLKEGEIKETQLHSIISRGFVPTLVIKLKGMEE